MHKIEFNKSVEKDLKKIPTKDLKKIIEKIESLTENPFPDGFKALKGDLKGYYRIRQGNYRVVYKVENKILTIFIVRVGNRKEIYKD